MYKRQGKNQARTQFLHEGQIRSFKGDIVPGESFSKLNAECKFYADFPFHLLLTGECKQFDSWIEQLLDVEDTGDLNIIFMKFNRIGRYVAIQPKLTWSADNFIFYGSKKCGDWYIMEFDTFFNLNKDRFKEYAHSGSSDTTSIISLVTRNSPATIALQ